MGTKYRKARVHYSAPEFDISTKDIQDYIQGRVNVVLNILKQESKYENLDEIPVKIAAAQASASFYPLLVALPVNVLESEASNDGKEVPSIWIQNEENDEANIIKDLEEFFKMYTFKKSEIKEFKNRDYQRKLGIRPKNAYALADFSRPRFKSFAVGDEKVMKVFFCIDPVRVFTDMLTEDGENPESFTIEITFVKKIRNSQYEYRVVKKKQKNFNNSSDSFDKDLDSVFKNV